MIRFPQAPRRTAAIGLGALALSVPGLACGEKDEPDLSTAATETTATLPAGTVNTGDNFFEPASLEVKVGDTVTWTNTGQELHNVQGPDFRSPDAFGAGQSYSNTFKAPGSFAYLCTLHPTQMKGTIVVK
jgi:plastocyanin